MKKRRYNFTQGSVPFNEDYGFMGWDALEYNIYLQVGNAVLAAMRI
jgi:hypothetical protein